MSTEQLKRVLESQVVVRSMTGLILFSALLLGFETHQPLMNQYGDFIHKIDRLVVWIFALEVCLRIISFGRHPWLYFKDGWNLTDFLIVAACLIPFGGSAFAVLRLVRVLRVFRLVTRLPRLQALVEGLVKSIPSLGYVGALLAIHFYIFGVLGALLFGKNDPVHFGSLASSLLTLFQVLTLEGWVELMRIQQLGCDRFGYQEFAGLCVSPSAHPIAAPLYFVAFVILGTMIILNLVIGVIIGNMTESREKPNQAELDSVSAEVRALRVEIQRLSAFLAKKSE